MDAVTFDTQAYVEELINGGVPQAQASAMARAQKQSLSQMVELRDLATKADLRETELRIQKQIADTAAASERHLINLMLVITTAILAAVGFGVGYIVSRLPG